jgi:polysaccharide biosynthesis protein PslG
VKAAYTNIKAANPNAIVIAGVGGPRSSGGGGNVSAKVWMNQLVADKTVKFDAYSQHIYPSQGPKFSSPSYDKAFPTWNSLELIYDTLDKKRKGMKLYVTEAGYTTATTPFRNVKVSPSQQNTYLKQLYNLPLVKSPRMAAVVWFNLQDNKNWPGGLLKANKSKKPSYNSFVTFARRPIPGNLRSALAN